MHNSVETKMLLVVVLFLTIASGALADDEGKKFSARGLFALQLLGNHEVSLGGPTAEEDVEVGFSSAAELFYQPHSNFRLGAGFEGQLGRSLKSFPGDFQFFPLYGVAMFPLDLRFITPYAIVKVGYGFFLGDIYYKGTQGVLTGGLYYSIGAGAEFLEYELFGRKCRLVFQATYSVNHGSVYDDFFGYSADVRYSRIDLCLGGWTFP